MGLHTQGAISIQKSFDSVRGKIKEFYFNIPSKFTRNPWKANMN